MRACQGAFAYLFSRGGLGPARELAAERGRRAAREQRGQQRGAAGGEAQRVEGGELQGGLAWSGLGLGLGSGLGLGLGLGFGFGVGLGLGLRLRLRFG